MTIRDSEIAAVTVGDALDAKAVEAARTYPDLKILCLRCNTSYLGSVFEEHLKTHLENTHGH